MLHLESFILNFELLIIWPVRSLWFLSLSYCIQLFYRVVLDLGVVQFLPREMVISYWGSCWIKVLNVYFTMLQRSLLTVFWWIWLFEADVWSLTIDVWDAWVISKFCLFRRRGYRKLCICWISINSSYFTISFVKHYLRPFQRV